MDGLEVLVLVGSPRPHGRSARFAAQLVEELSAQGHRVKEWQVQGKAIAGCVGCERCREGYSCVIRDDMSQVYAGLETCDVLHVVVPVYFSGVPSQFKAVLDRLQPLWEMRCGPNSRRDPSEHKRPYVLHVIGEGGDPFGFEPLRTEVKSALGAAGLYEAGVEDLVGQDL